MARKYKISGGNPLKGKVRLHGAKNVALPIIAAGSLTDDEVVLHNVPVQLNDIRIMLDILEILGKTVQREEDRVIISGPLTTHVVPPELGKRIRSSLLFLGIMLNRFGKTSIPNPGGCNIGDRKFDLHIFGLEQLGATFEFGEMLTGSCDSFRGTEISLYLPTTVGTQNIILGALAAEGETVIKNANTRPENLDFASFLRSMGADVDMYNRVVKIQGGKVLHDTEYTLMNGPDELVSYIIAAAVTGGELQIENADLKYIPTDVKVLREAGVDIFEWGNSVYISAKHPLKPIDIFTTPYPGINSDLQPLYSVFAAVAPGESTVTDMRFTERFQYVEELKKFSIDIEAYGNCAVIQGGKVIKGSTVRAPDLRGGFAMILAGLVAKGTTIIENVYQIERGYINLPELFSSIGANIQVIDE